MPNPCVRRTLAAALPLLAALLSGCATAPAPRADACPEADRLTSSIQNFCQVTAGILWRGARPDGAGAPWLMANVRTVINLELVNDDKSALVEGRYAGTAREVGYFRVRDWELLPLLAPQMTDDNVAHFLAIVEREPKPIYVHCRSGQNRTGVMVAAYRVLVEGVSADAAIGEMSRYEGYWFKADADYVRGLTPERRRLILEQARAWQVRLKADARLVCRDGSCAVGL
ncbi:MAG: dual specificity protein phosphatase family protein [Burkholderiales bacterium]|nr:dual specificity protein phosphatase family protein [Burkholderiales bacterium]